MSSRINLVASGASIQVQTPASGPLVADAIMQALRVVETFAQNERRLDAQESENCRLWRELLMQSRGQLFGDMVPTIPRGDLAAPIGISLTARRWARFQRWYERCMVTPLRRASLQSGIPIPYGGRTSNRRGGRAEFSEARYFVSFDEPELVPAVDPPAAGLPIVKIDAAAAQATLRPGRLRSAEFGPAMSCEFPERPPHGTAIPSTPTDSMDPIQLRLRDLEAKNSRLMRLLAERDLEIDALKNRQSHE